MKRFYIAAVALLCAVGFAHAQDGALAPTVPVVPPPMLQNGNLVAPSGGMWGASGPRLFSRTTWSPVRSPVVAGDMNPTAPATGYPMPPMPAGIGGADGLCGAARCGLARGGLNWDRMKAWLSYRPSKTELPKLQPTPYVPPLQGMFSCASGSDCVSRNGSPQQPAFTPPAPPMMTPPASAGAVVMPPRGTQGAVVQPTWQGRTVPAATDAGIAGYRFAQPENKAAQKPALGPVVSAAYRPWQK